MFEGNALKETDIIADRIAYEGSVVAFETEYELRAFKPYADLETKFVQSEMKTHKWKPWEMDQWANSDQQEN